MTLQELISMSIHPRLLHPLHYYCQAAQDDAALDALLDHIMSNAIAPGAIEESTRSYLSMIQNTSSGLDEPDGSFTMRFQV